ncbi:MAG: PspA/IM30 family protein [Anaerolineae bacterium]|nr:PspA/IM30 family protein [Anaerolineae bacterium]
MAQTLLGKIQILISASLHSLFDQALRSNSLAVFDEYIRDAERSMETLKSALVDLSVTIKTLRAKYDDAADDAAKLDLQVDAALKADKNVLAKVAQSKLNQQLDIARTYKEQYEKQSETYNTLLEVVQVLQAKVDILHSQRDQVATLLQLIKSKNIVSTSIKDIQTIADDRTARIVEDVRTQLDTADARLEVATTRLSDQMSDEVGDAQLNAQLEARRQRLGLT